MGKRWITRFLDRHPDISSRYSGNLDRQRAYASDPNKIKDYFRKFNNLRITHNLQPADIYNMDEKGFLMGMSTKTKVVTRVARKNPRVTHDGKRELITDLETICGDGTSMAPFLIFKAKAGYSMGWYAGLDDHNVLLAYSNKGWTDDSLGYEYISRHFIKFAHPPTTPNHTRLIILDGHSSHINWDFCMFGLEHNIILLCLPAHSTHLLQPLDVAVFSPLQHFYGLAVDDFCRHQGGGIHKAVFWPLLKKARSEAITSDNILAGFGACGLIPFCQKVVLDRLQFSTASSTKTPQWQHPNTPSKQLKTPQKSTDFRRETNQVLAAVRKVSQEELGKLISRLGELGAAAQANLQIPEEIYRMDRQKAISVPQKADRRRLTTVRVIDGAEALRLYQIPDKQDLVKADRKVKKPPPPPTKSSKKTPICTPRVRRPRVTFAVPSSPPIHTSFSPESITGISDSDTAEFSPSSPTPLSRRHRQPPLNVPLATPTNPRLPTAPFRMVLRDPKS